MPSPAFGAPGEQVAFFTNNSGPTMAEHLGHLAAAGIEAAPAELLTSAHAAASLLPPGPGPRSWAARGSRRRSSERGVQAGGQLGRTTPTPWSSAGRPTFSYDELSAASAAIAEGAASWPPTPTPPCPPRMDRCPERAPSSPSSRWRQVRGPRSRANPIRPPPIW